ncbi:MAG: Wadjet anti-phage system protein JetD domain-containing protein [Bacteroidota bacterium]|jgi:hypothetical protein
MISPEDIKQNALRWWPLLLQSQINGETFFPRSIDRIGKVRSGDVRQQFDKVQHEIEQLFRNSKNETGIGYLVEKSDYNFRRTGSHELPERILIETLNDYLHITGKKREWSCFTKNLDLICLEIPNLKEWALSNCKWLVSSDTEWLSMLLVCKYFLVNPRPEMYVRQLPITIHTKFIEENTTLLQSLLDFLIADHIRNSSTKRIAERYYLKYDEPLIRIRLLDESLSVIHDNLDFSIPLSSFKRLAINCKRVLIAENKMNFLTLPNMPSTIALWSGGGFSLGNMKNITWLNEKEICYWGDIDTHGFLILSQLRSYFSHVTSFLMNKEVLMAYKDDWQTGANTPQENPEHLTAAEAELFRYVKENNLRLEQEKIRHHDVIDVLKLLV